MLAEFGPDNPHFWISAAYLFVLAGVSLALGERCVLAGGIAFVSAIVFTYFVGPSLAILVFLIAVIAVSIYIRRVRPSRRVRAVLFAVAIMLSMSVMYGHRQLALREFDLRRPGGDLAPARRRTGQPAA